MPTIAAWESPAAETNKRPLMLAGAVAAAVLAVAGLFVFRSTSKEVPPPAVSLPAPATAALPPVAAAAPVPPAVKTELRAKPAVVQPEQPKLSFKDAEPVAVEPKRQPANPVIEIAAAQPKLKQEPEPEMAAPKLSLASNDAALSSISKLPVALPNRQSVLVPATPISRTTPVYPAIARQMGASGAVLMNVTISPQGSVTAVRVISGPPPLHQAAISAVRQWRYKPAMLNGQPAESTANVQINFAR